MTVKGHRLDRMFNPKTVAVIGDKAPGYMWLNFNMLFKENGGNLYSVQIDPNEIKGIEALGIQNFTSLADVPEPIDYAVVAVPRQVAPIVLKDLIECEAAGAGFFTSGFAETGEELGVKLQEQLTVMAREANFNLVGPNCMGLDLPRYGVGFSRNESLILNGRIGFLSQSGTHGSMFSNVALANGVPLHSCASFGNAIALNASDYIEYFSLEDDVEVIGMYIEGVSHGRKFFETLKAASEKKPVVVWKGGQTEAGTRATLSHTGSMASDQAVWEGLMRQCGVITTHSLDETIDVMKLLLNAPEPKGDGMALLAMTGGHSVSIADAFAKEKLQVPRLSEASYSELKTFFNIVGGSYQNPLDMAGTIRGNPETLTKILNIIEADENIQAVAMDMAAGFLARQFKAMPESLDNMLDALRTHMDRSLKPFMVVMHPAHEEIFTAEVKPKFNERKIPTYPSFERAAAAMARVYKYVETKRLARS
ncbi:MAG: CoA-binding protein [Candidatus Adiutricales bacterium]